MLGDNVKEAFKPRINLAGPRVNVVAVACFLIPALAAGFLSWYRHSWWEGVAGVLLGGLLALSPKVAKQWERGVVLRLGRYVGLRGPGLFWVLPLIDTVTVWIDQRTITTNFAAEQTLTSDTVPVNVDAVLYWMVYDPEKRPSKFRTMPRQLAGRPRPHCATSSAAPRSPTCCAGENRSSWSCKRSSTRAPTPGA